VKSFYSDGELFIKCIEKSILSFGFIKYKWYVLITYDYFTTRAILIYSVKIDNKVLCKLILCHDLHLLNHILTFQRSAPTLHITLAVEYLQIIINLI